MGGSSEGGGVVSSWGLPSLWACVSGVDCGVISDGFVEVESGFALSGFATSGFVVSDLVESDFAESDLSDFVSPEAGEADAEWRTRAVVVGRGAGAGDGILAALTVLGSSRSLRKSVPAAAGRGTLSVAPV